jgi:hypothetical protein
MQMKSFSRQPAATCAGLQALPIVSRSRWTVSTSSLG